MNVRTGFPSWLSEVSNVIARNNRELASLILLSLAITATYFGTATSIVDQWLINDSFKHGFLIVPISIALVWYRKSDLAEVPKRYSIPGILALLTCSLIWWVGDTLGIQTVKHFAFVAMFPMTVWSIFGSYVFRVLVFPLTFLFFAVPFGEFLIPMLVDSTASLAVLIMSAMDIPVYRDSSFFYIPTGNYEVAKACSGLNYLITTVVVATLVSKSFNHGLKLGFLFVLSAGLLAVAANGFRAAIVVSVLHFTNFDIAAGQDHEFIGLIVFSVLMILLVLFGRWLSNDRLKVQATSSRYSASARTKSFQLKAHGTIIFMLVGIAIFSGRIVGSLWPETITPVNRVQFTGLPGYISDWYVQYAENPEWTPIFTGATTEHVFEFRKESWKVLMAILQYDSTRQGAEVTSAGNEVADPSEWDIVRRESRDISISKEINLPVDQVVIRSRRQQRKIWHWVHINGEAVRNGFDTKIRDLRNRVLGKKVSSHAILISIPITSTDENEDAILVNLIYALHEKLSGCLVSKAETSICSFETVQGK